MKLLPLMALLAYNPGTVDVGEAKDKLVQLGERSLATTCGMDGVTYRLVSTNDLIDDEVFPFVMRTYTHSADEDSSSVGAFLVSQSGEITLLVDGGQSATLDGKVDLVARLDPVTDKKIIEGLRRQDCSVYPSFRAKLGKADELDQATYVDLFN